MAKKRVYRLDPGDYADEPEWLRDAGQIYKISGVLLQGNNQEFLILAPSAVPTDVEEIGEHRFVGERVLQVEIPSLEEWCAFLARSDDPLIFERDETGTIKTVHRKVQYAISGAVQWEIFARDGYRCMYCGKEPPEISLTIDHFEPLELGGKDDRSNYVSCCRRCGKAKGSISPQEFCTKMGYDWFGIGEYIEGRAPAHFIAHLT